MAGAAAWAASRSRGRGFLHLTQSRGAEGTAGLVGLGDSSRGGGGVQGAGGAPPASGLDPSQPPMPPRGWAHSRCSGSCPCAVPRPQRCPWGHSRAGTRLSDSAVLSPVETDSLSCSRAQGGFHVQALLGPDPLGESADVRSPRGKGAVRITQTQRSPKFQAPQGSCWPGTWWSHLPGGLRVTQHVLGAGSSLTNQAPCPHPWPSLGW